MANPSLPGLAAALTLGACAPTAETVSQGMTPAIGDTVRVADRDVHVYEAGHPDAPAVILLHGASGNLRDFTFAMVDELTRSYRVLAFDRPGLGYSDPLHGQGESPREQAIHLAQAADALGVETAVIVGHSFGASVAMAWALERPDQAAAVVSLAGATNPWPGGLGPWYSIAGSTIGGATVVPLIAAFAPRSVADNAVEAIFTPDPIPDGYLDYVGADLTLRSPVLRANARQVGGLKPHITEMAADYPDLTLPIEILHGDEDTIVPVEIHGERLAQMVPSARLTVLSGVGHMPQHADPDAAHAAIHRAAHRAGLRSSVASR